MEDSDKITSFKDQIKRNIKWSTKRPPIVGGQSCGMPVYPVILTSDELDFEIIIGCHRSQLKNKELAYTLFCLALDEIIK